MPQYSRSTTPSTPLKALADRWWIAVVLVIVGGGAGAGASTLQSPTYTGEARVAVGSESLDARVVAGYSQAATQLASDVARYVNDAQAQATVAPLLGDSAGDVSTISASPIPDSSVVRVEVQAKTAAAASAGAQAVAQQLTDQVNAVSGETSDSLLQQYTDLSNKVAVAQQAAEDARANLASLTAGRADQAELDAAKVTIEQTTSALDVLQVQQTALGQRYRSAVTSTPAAAGLRIVQNGQVSGDNQSSRMQKLGLVGAVLGLLLALLLAVLLDRRSTNRARDEAENDTGTPSADGTRLDVDGVQSATVDGPSSGSEAYRS